MCILGEERDALSSWPFLSRVFTHLKEIMLYRRRAGRQVDVPADDREGTALHALLDGRGNVEDVVPAAPEPKPKPRVNKGGSVSNGFISMGKHDLNACTMDLSMVTLGFTPT